MVKSRWVSCRDPELLVKECADWNRDQLYEILWEYSSLKAPILRERKAKGWLYYEDGSRAGFALGRELRGWWHFEELWGPSDGSSELPIRIGKQDVLRAQSFRKVLYGLGPRILVRAAVDNVFGNIVAHELGGRWSGGRLLAARDLKEKVPVVAPSGFSLRRFQKDDEKEMSRIHLAAFNFPSTPRAYLDWATSSNCRTTIAMNQGQIVGFLTAEKRRYQRYGDFNIAIDPRFHHRGVGSALMETGLNDLLDMGCKTAIADFYLQNTKVQALNRKHGFEIVRVYNDFQIEP